MNRQDAQENADAVENYWHGRGYFEVKAKVVQEAHVNGWPIYRIRTNLVRGLPPAEAAPPRP